MSSKLCQSSEYEYETFGLAIFSSAEGSLSISIAALSNILKIFFALSDFM
jgi:hypothetical protein